VHDLPLLVSIGAALSAALVGGVIARRVGVPTLVGYLLAGMAIGPFTPGFVGDVDSIRQLAELGVIFLMFGVGLHFSLRDLWRVRAAAVPGAIAQMTIATVLGVLLAQAWGWDLHASLVLGLSISVASTVVLLRGLMDGGLLDSRHGRLAVGWLVLEDLATVLLLLLLPALAPAETGLDWAAIGWTLMKAGAFIALMLVGGKRIVPWVLMQVSHMRSRELFLLVTLVAAVGIALSAAALFGVSLALGAFLAGVVVGESPLSHQVGNDVLPFREAFAVLFFVSVGMLVNPASLLNHAGPVALLTALIVVGKAIAAILICAAVAQPLRSGLVVAAGLSQIGEFSFILAQSGLNLGMFDHDQHSLVLAGGVLSITVNPLMFRLVDPIERWIGKTPALARRLDRARPVEPAEVAPKGGGHVVVVGCGRVGSHIVDVLGRIGVPRLVIESDASIVEDLGKRGVPVLYGDAANSDVLQHARLDDARALVVTIPLESAAAVAVAGARELAPNVPIVARAATRPGVKSLSALGAEDVIHPELEGGLEVVRHVLLRLGYPLREVQKYADIVRREGYDLEVNTDAEHRALHRLLAVARDVEIVWMDVAPKSAIVGRTLADVNLRARTGAWIVAVHRGSQVLPIPAPDFRIAAGDRVGLIGDPEQIGAAEPLLQ
jgi:K+:H+ antiporter